MIVGGVNFCTNAQDRLVLVVSHELAPGGYVYLAVAQGRGTLGAVLFENFSLANQCRDKSIKALQELYQFSMEEAQPFSGRGDFFLEQSFTKEGRLLVGEAAGLQDYWFGFGMRYAIRSGYLASQSILEGVDFGKLLHQDGLIENARASLAVRFLFEVRGDSCQWLWRKWSDPGRVLGNMRSYYRLTLPRLLLYHLARFLWRKKRALSRTDNDLWAKPE
jgi:flavin-dependent dehydrogenase